MGWLHFCRLLRQVGGDLRGEMFQILFLCVFLVASFPLSLYKLGLMISC